MRHEAEATAAIYAVVDLTALSEAARLGRAKRGHAMSQMRRAVEFYVRVRRALGYKLLVEGRMLAQFATPRGARS